MVEYFLLRNLGFDGLMVTRYPTLSEAEADYKEALREQARFKESFPDLEPDKGLVVVRGEVVVSDTPGDVF